MITITDNRPLGLGISIKNEGKYAFVSHNKRDGFFLNTYGKMVVQSDFKEYLSEIKLLTKVVRNLNKQYGY